MFWDLPGGPVIKTSPSNAGGAGSTPGQGAKIPHASGQKTKTKNGSNVVTNSVNTLKGTSMVAQWLITSLPMQGTRVQALVREDPTCCGATKPVRHNY